ncbi:MAG: hypothetical protein UY21_C0001G0001 [Microgenomates group bacterium GW2011_GWA1_48_10]|nr:MAG: hypothetical protein UY21_C0001G0001 [Microgenomates group bacterium GW2011_GWA1_48_10]
MSVKEINSDRDEERDVVPDLEKICLQAAKSAYAVYRSTPPEKALEIVGTNRFG